MAISANDIVIIVFKAFELLIILRILMSWVPFGRGSDFRSFVRDFTEPILRPFRVTIGGGGVGIDLAPIIAFIVLYQVEMLILRLINMM